MPRVLTLAGALVLAACPGRDVHEGPPRLVVVVVLDQVGSWVLEAHRSSLRPEGAIRRAIRKGAYHHRVVYDYAATNTGPGHAAIFTGAAPGRSGIVANRFWDARRDKLINLVDDGQSPVLGRQDRHASPRALKVEGVADVLGRQRPESKVVAISMKDRGAVLAGGRRPDLALWYDASTHGFTTSRYYARRLPSWLGKWARKHPTRERFTVWQPFDRAVLARDAGPDDAPGEGDWEGLGKAFPHDLGRSTSPYEALLATPQGTELLLALARQCASHLDLGEDDAADLLTISISGTDYVGHAYGAESWEARDNLIRVDLALGQLLTRLERRGPVALLITADHGVAPMPESARSRSGRRIQFSDLVGAVDGALDQKFGPAEWVRALYPPYLYLDLREDPARTVPVAIEALRKVPGLHEVFDVRALRAEPVTPGAPASEAARIRRSVQASIAPDRGGELFMVPQPYAYFDEGTPTGTGTDHGSPWSYDTDVPVIVAGPGVAHLETREPLELARVSTTIAALLGIEAPPNAGARPLPGVRRMRRPGGHTAH